MDSGQALPLQMAVVTQLAALPEGAPCGWPRWSIAVVVGLHWPGWVAPTEVCAAALAPLLHCGGDDAGQRQARRSADDGLGLGVHYGGPVAPGSVYTPGVADSPIAATFTGQLCRVASPTGVHERLELTGASLGGHLDPGDRKERNVTVAISYLELRSPQGRARMRPKEFAYLTVGVSSTIRGVISDPTRNAESGAGQPGLHTVDVP